jgi:hypothetical protein
LDGIDCEFTNFSMVNFLLHSNERHSRSPVWLTKNIEHFFLDTFKFYHTSLLVCRYSYDLDYWGLDCELIYIFSFYKIIFH